MNPRLEEECALLLTVGKWLVLASLVGALVGLSTAAFLMILHHTVANLSDIPYHFLALPIGLAASAWMTTTLAPEAGGQGLERLVQAIHYRSGRIKAQVIPAKAAATLLTLATGGCAGNIGPCAQIGGGFASWVSDLVRFPDADRRVLVICGISAGFAAVLGTPIAGGIFAIEALSIGVMSYHALLPAVIAAFAGHHVALALGLTSWTQSIQLTVQGSASLLPWSAVIGVVCGLCALLLIESLTIGRRVSLLWTIAPPWQGLFAGFAILGCVALTSADFVGMGVPMLTQALSGGDIVWYAMFVKIIVTTLTLCFGGSGGIVLPICIVGAAAGSLFGALAHLDQSVCAALGLVGLMAGAVNTPITATIFAMEVFGAEIGPYALLTCTISFVISGHRSAIPTQLLRLNKAQTLLNAAKRNMDHAQLDVQLWDDRPLSEDAKRVHAELEREGERAKR